MERSADVPPVRSSAVAPIQATAPELNVGSAASTATLLLAHWPYFGSAPLQRGA